MKIYIFSFLFTCLTFAQIRGQNKSAYYSDTPLVQETDMENLELLFQKARSLSELGKDQAAIMTYQEILKIDPRNETAYIELGEIAFRTENWAYSNTLMHELVSLNPEDSKSRKVMIKVYRTFNVISEELKLVYELHQLNPSDIVLLNRLDTLYAYFGLHPERVKVLESLIKMEPQKKAHYIRLADLYYNQLGKVSKSIGIYERFLELQPADAEVLSLLALRYGESDDYANQIECYERIYEQDIDTVYWKKVLLQSYWNALRQYDLRFDIREALERCEGFMEYRGERDDLRALHRGLASATKPTINYRTALRGFDFAGKTKNWKNTLSIGFLGPFPGSSISVENNYMYIRQDYEPFIPGEYEPGLLESRIYQGRVMFDQRFSKLSMHVDAGIHQPISGPSDMRPHIISTASITYKPFKNYSLSASHNFITLTDNPVAIDQQIRRQQVLIGMQCSLLKDLMVSASLRQGLLSDGNKRSNANIRLEYNLFETVFRSKDIEARRPLGYDYTGEHVSMGVQYAYLDYTRESYIYPTVSNEHLFSFYIHAEKQLIKSFFSRAEAFLGMNNYRNLIWGYNLTLEKHISWRFNLFLQWDHFLAPYTIGNTHYTNSEGSIQLGVISRF